MMEAQSLKNFVEVCGGSLLKGSPSAQFKSICTDTRRVAAGDLFLAIKGEYFDGHHFLKDAEAKGAAGVVVARNRQPGKLPECAVVAVDDPRAALGTFAAAYRRNFDLPMIAVGGSNGKTTTKELIASVLRRKFQTLHSEASFNNDIGVPLTLLRLEKSHQAAVLEIGTNHPGEIAPLAKMIQPRFGVITNIGREHLEFFGDLDGVAREEGALAEALPAGGQLFLSGDSEWTPGLIQRTRASVTRVGFADKNDWRAANLRYDKRGLVFRVESSANKDFCGEYKLALLGRHQVLNALFAIAIGAQFGLSPAEIRTGLESCEPPKMRCQLWEIAGIKVLDDCYNANADSMIAALQTLLDLPCKGRRIAILGDMAELGVQSDAAHEEVGRHAARLGVGQLIAIGKMAPMIARGARAGGLTRVIEFADVESAASASKSLVKQGDLVLLKASRSTRLERISDALRGGEPARKAA